MTELFPQDYLAQWRDMDFNQHMANSAFLDYAGNTRFRFFESVGLTPARFAELGLGPVRPPDQLKAAMAQLPRSDDFEQW